MFLFLAERMRLSLSPHPQNSVIALDDEVKIAIQERAPAVQLRKLMEAKGESSLFEKAVREAARGVISLEEACKFR